MNTRTRFKITLAVVLIITTFGVIGTFRNMENLAITVVGSLMTSLGLYVWGQTTRPTNTETS
ncbi:MAG: hypothetical protein FWG79_09860 [Bacteroidales bacterium]|nr:hypothetical protein [Bacteroidales bacterium]